MTQKKILGYDRIGVYMKQILILAIIFGLNLGCASSSQKDGKEGDGKLMESIIEKAQSEEGQKAIQTVKEQATDKENQEKVKSLISKDKKK